MKPLCASIKHLLPSKNIVEKWKTMMKRFTFIERPLNSFHINVPFLYPMKMWVIEMEHWCKTGYVKIKNIERDYLKWNFIKEIQFGHTFWGRYWGNYLNFTAENDIHYLPIFQKHLFASFNFFPQNFINFQVRCILEVCLGPCKTFRMQLFWEKKSFHGRC